MKLISIITPVFNEEENITDCYKSVRRIFETQLQNYNYEHIFCDNASKDKTLEILKSLAKEDKRVKIIVNSRNFGASKSSFNGLLNASGDAVVYTIAADLQDPPGLIPEFIKKWEEGYKIVYGVREKREESWIMVFFRKRYYRLIRKFSEFEIPNDVGDFQLLDKKVVDNLKTVEDYFPYVRGLIAHTGFSALGINYTHQKRKAGKAKGNLPAIIDLGINGIVSFTNAPLRIAMIGGFLMAFLSFLIGFVNLILFAASALFGAGTNAIPGMATMIVGMFFFFGIILFFIGILGEYIGAIHAQVRKRPMVVEEGKINFEDSSID